MADAVKFVPNSGVFRDILNGGEITSVISGLTDQATRYANSVGTGEYEGDTMPGKVSVHGMVKTTDYKSIVSNAKHNTLVKALESVSL